ncbi:class E sortase [Streptomyces sp. NPDC020917]|uniref:class E sortase n=1 Tax=Streptomyces sp. NPDC020917 TaxID=3365102 RepID=UPI0037B97D21
MSYEDTGQFKAAVERLDDPLNDPLPGRPPAAPQHAAPPPAPSPAPEPASPGDGGQPGAAPSSPWFRAGPERPQPVGAATFVEPQPAAGGLYAEPLPATDPFAEPQQAPDPFAGRQQTADPFAALYTEPPQAAADAYVEPLPTRDDPFAEPRQHPPAGTGTVDEPQAEDTAVLPEVDAAASPAAPPADGGRAARRKAARQGGGGHRARARGGAPAPAEEAAQPSAPLSRVEARRAAKAAKDSPSVVISRIVGELFITAGVVMLLFVTYQLWWTNVRAHQQANSASNNLEHQWATTSGDPNRAPGVFQPGQGFAIMYIPKLDVKAPVAQGVSKTKVLDHGMIGHYDGSLNTAMPWDKTGNFAVAAHRNTHGEPFRYINHLVPGDKIVVETATTYYTYQVTSSLASTPPSNTSVLQPIPTGSGFTKPGRYITLTTCTPEFTSTNRLIVWGKLVEERPRSKGKPDALLKG